MDEKEFLKMMNEMEEEEHSILGTKGMEYTQGDLRHDRLANFFRLGNELRIDPKIICWIYLKKHLDSIVCYIKEGKEFSSETIKGRVNDARNYLLILYAIIEQQKSDKRDD